MTLAITAERLSKSFWIAAPGADGRSRRVEKVALRDVSFDVAEGEVLGIIGRNGAGKSTLLKILSRITKPTRGRAVIRGRVAALLEVGTGMHPEMTGRENIYLNGGLLGMRKAEVTTKLDEIVAFAEVGEYIDTPIKHYSSGMKLRLAFAVAAYLSADVMIVDEVLAVGDAAFQKKCLGVMREGTRAGRTTLFVSHHMPSVEALCNRVMLLSSGVVTSVGAPGDVIRDYLRPLTPDLALPELIDVSAAPRGWITGNGTIREVVFRRHSTDAAAQPWAIAFGEPWRLSFSFTLGAGLVDVGAAVGFRSDSGQEVFAALSSESGVTFHPGAEGVHTATVDLSDVRFRPGRYALEVALISGGTLVDHVTECAWLLVEDRVWPGRPAFDPGKGLIAPLLPWRREERGAGASDSSR